MLDVRRVGAQGVVVHGNGIVYVEKIQFIELSTGQCDAHVLDCTCKKHIIDGGYPKTVRVSYYFIKQN